MRQSRGLERLAERADDLAVDPLQGLDLGVGPALVAGLVGGLDVDADEVVILQGGDPGTALGGVVGVEVAGGRRGRRSGPSRRASPTPRTRSTAEMIAPFSPCRSGNSGATGALPWPQSQIALAGRLPAASRARLTGWSRTTSAPASHQLAEQLGAGAPREVIDGGLVGTIVRRGGLRVVVERASRRACPGRSSGCGS